MHPDKLTADELTPGRAYTAEFKGHVTGHVQLGRFEYQSGEGFLYFTNGSFLSGDGIIFYEWDD